MDFRLGSKSERLREEVRDFLQENFSSEAHAYEREHGDGHQWELYAKLAERGWVSASWPVELGGQGRESYEMVALQEELSRAEYPRYALANNSFIGPAILEYGTEAQKQEIVGGITAGRTLLAMGYSEPGSGSDVASAQTRAVRDGDEWVITGQKMFTTMAHLSQYIFTLTLTDPSAPKRKGLTMFLVPTDAPELQIQPVHTMGGERTNIVYFGGVRVDDALRVGEVNGGWAVLGHALGLEHGVGFYDRISIMLERALEWADEAIRDGRRVLDRPDARERLARAAMLSEVSKLLVYRSAWMVAEGQKDRGEGPMAKLFSAEAYIEATSDLLDLLGPEALVQFGEPGAAVDGDIEHHHRGAQITSIYGGTSEIQRSLIAEAYLSLPRSRP